MWHSALYRRQFGCCVLFLGIWLLLAAWAQPVAAQGVSQWTPRQRIPGIGDLADTPILAVDQSGAVHAFHTYPIDEVTNRSGIFYSRWTLDEGWSEPVDILLSVENLIAVQGVFIDGDGIIHLIYYCCNDAAPKIFYTKVPALFADQAPAWSMPLVIGEAASAPAAATLAGDQAGNLFMLYSGVSQGRGVYAAYSDDAGAMWTEPVPIFLTYDGNLLPYNLQLLPGETGALHAVWVINMIDGNGLAIYYARFEPTLLRWSEPFALSAVDPTGPERTSGSTLVEHNGELIVIYTYCPPCERRMRRSDDGGQTWTNPVDPFVPTRGDYGPASFVTDSSGQLHAIFGDRAHGQNLWHSVWNGRWLPPRPVVPPDEAAAYDLKGDPLEFTPSKPATVITMGNVILATWSTDPGHGDNGSWYSYRVLDAPRLPTMPLPVPTVAPSPTQVVIPTPTLTPTPTPIRTTGSGSFTNPVPRNTSTSTLMMIGVVPVALLISVVLFGSQQFRRRKY